MNTTHTQNLLRISMYCSVELGHSKQSQTLSPVHLLGTACFPALPVSWPLTWLLTCSSFISVFLCLCCSSLILAFLFWCWHSLNGCLPTFVGFVSACLIFTGWRSVLSYLTISQICFWVQSQSASVTHPGFWTCALHPTAPTGSPEAMLSLSKSFIVKTCPQRAYKPGHLSLLFPVFFVIFQPKCQPVAVLTSSYKEKQNLSHLHFWKWQIHSLSLFSLIISHSLSSLSRKWLLMSMCCSLPGCSTVPHLSICQAHRPINQTAECRWVWDTMNNH